jgi:hypothetical protein
LQWEDIFQHFRKVGFFAETWSESPSTMEELDAAAFVFFTAGETVRF